VAETNFSKLNTVLLVVVVVLLLWNLFWKPQVQLSGRFQAVIASAGAALDTKTGQLCRTAGPPDKDKIPLCSELK
jgi:hypothetical protein